MPRGNPQSEVCAIRNRQSDEGRAEVLEFGACQPGPSADGVDTPVRRRQDGPDSTPATSMAQLTQKEFQQAVSLLAGEMGLQRLRDRLVRLNGLVTRRKVTSPEALAEQLYMLSAGLRRQVPATLAFYAIWNDSLHAKLGEDGEKGLEKLADAVNACLNEDDEIIADKAAELETAVAEYDKALRAVAGAEMARLDMLLKAVPAVAAKVRAMPLEREASE
jgi:hypothetical protein